MDENRDDEQLSGVLDETHVNLTIFEGLLGAPSRTACRQHVRA